MAQISELEYGRSAMGAQALKADVNSRITSISNKLTGAEYDAVLRAIAKNWNGADAEAFAKEFKGYVKSLKALLKKYNSLVTGAIDNDMKGFQNSQAKIAKTIKSNIKY